MMLLQTNNINDNKNTEKIVCQAPCKFFSIRAAQRNKLVEFAPEFAIDLVYLIEQNRGHTSVMLRILQLRID